VQDEEQLVTFIYVLEAM